MLVDTERNRLLFRKLAQLLGRSPSHPQPDTVHQFRTLSRRIEAVLPIVCPEPGVTERKLLRSLRRLRRHAGALRDIDVQIAALRKLKIGRESERRARLMDALVECRAEREEELRDWLSDRRRNRLRRRLSRCAAALDRAAALAASTAAGAPPASAPEEGALCAGAEQVLGCLDPAPEALRRFAAAARRTALTSENLHAFRTACKKVRYVAEMGAGRRSQAIVASLKRVQDAIGDWRDWDTLRATAEDMFGRSLDSALVMALRNVTQAKFEEARHIAVEVRKQLLAENRAVTSAPRKARRAAAPSNSGADEKPNKKRTRPAEHTAAQRKAPRRELASRTLHATHGVA